MLLVIALGTLPETVEPYMSVSMHDRNAIVRLPGKVSTRCLCVACHVARGRYSQSDHSQDQGALDAGEWKTGHSAGMARSATRQNEGVLRRFCG